MKSLLLCLCFSLLGLVAFAQIHPPYLLKESKEVNRHFSAERLKRVDQIFQQYIDSNWIAGAIALVAKEGKIIYYKALGYDDPTQKKKLEKEAIWRIASQTKAITSVGIMMLYEQGKFLLDDPISKYLPEFKKPVVLDKFNEADSSYTTLPAKKEITIRELLTHTAGIGYAQIGNKTMNAIYYKAGVSSGIGLKGGSLAENTKKIGRLPLFHQPGEAWTYGMNTDVLGYLIEVVSGKTLDQFLKTELFDPLGMKDTYFFIPKEKRHRLAMLHSDHPIKQTAINSPEEFLVNGKVYRDYPNMDEGTLFSGGGGLSSTAMDYAIFLQMMLNKGIYQGKRILSPSTVDMMTMNQIGNLREAKFGLGFELVTESTQHKTLLSPGSFSWGGMFASSYWADPKEQILGQLVLQHYPFSHREIAEKFKVAIYQALEN